MIVTEQNVIRTFNLPKIHVEEFQDRYSINVDHVWMTMHGDMHIVIPAPAYDTPYFHAKAAILSEYSMRAGDLKLDFPHAEDLADRIVAHDIVASADEHPAWMNQRDALHEMTYAAIFVADEPWDDGSETAAVLMRDHFGDIYSDGLDKDLAAKVSGMTRTPVSQIAMAAGAAIEHYKYYPDASEAYGRSALTSIEIYRHAVVHGHSFDLPKSPTEIR